MNRHALMTAWIAPALWMGLIALLSAVPGARIPEIPVPQYHKLVHFAEYAALGGLLFRGLMVSRVREDRLAWICLAALLFFAVSDEFHQYFTPGRSPSLEDVMADTLFGLIGANGYAAWLIRHSALHKSPQTRQP